MASYTPSLGLELITPGSQSGLWGNTTNNSLTLVDQAITGVTPISFAAASGTTYTLTNFNGAADEARSAVLNITGTATGSNTVVVPNKQKTYLVRNNTTQDVVFRTPSPSATYTVGAGYSILIFCDGNNNVFTGIQSPSTGTLSVNGGGTGATTFTAGFVKSPGGTSALTSASTVALGSEVSGTLPVTNGGTGQTSFTAGSVLLGNGSGAISPVVGGSSGQVLTWNGSTWGAATPASAGVTTFNGRIGAVTSQSGDYSSFYYPLSSNPSGYVTSSGSVAYATSAGSVPQIQGNSWAFIMAGADLRFGYSGTVPFTMNSGGNAYAIGSWINGSDQRIKENVSTISGALDKLGAIRPVEFSFKRDKKATADHYGVIAQELETVMPNLVHSSEMDEGDVQNIKAVSYIELVPVLVKAIQELKAEVDALKAAKQ